VAQNYQVLSDASQIVPMSEQQASDAQTALGGSGT
jgi:hypothetical protein